MPKAISNVLFVCLLMISLPACVLNLSGAGSHFNLASMGADFAPSDSEYLYIDLDVDVYERNGSIVPYYEISTSEEFGDSAERDSPSNCEIEHISGDEGEQNASENMMCILDIMEADLNLNNLPIIYNIPEGMCNYVYTYIPWHYNYKTGPGPAHIVKQTFTQGTGDAAENKEEYCIAEIDENGDGTTTKCEQELENLCIYKDPFDSSRTCCFGRYEVKDNGEVSNGGPGESVTKWSDLTGVDEGNWNEGGIKHCLGGPGYTSWDDHDKDGIPVVRSVPVEDEGFRDTIEIKGLHEVHGQVAGPSIPVANYLEDLDEDPEDLRDISRDDLPVFLRAPTGLEGVSPNKFAPNLFFTVECQDQAGEVLHKVSLMIREWNTSEEFIDFYNSGGSDDGDPDVEGDEGDDCQYENRNILDNERTATGQCNDHWDFDDYDENSPGLFPSIEYGAEGGSSSSSSE